MGKIHCRITRRHGVAGSNQQIECLRASIRTAQDTDGKQMGKDATRASSINNIDMAGALEAVKTYLSHYLANGETVHFDGIGSFQLSIGLKQMMPSDAEITARQIEVKSIIFRPAESLLTDIKNSTSFVIDEDKRDHATLDETLALLRSHFAACRQEQRAETLTLRRFSALCACSYTSARRRVKQLVADGYLLPSPDFRGHYLAGPTL